MTDTPSPFRRFPWVQVVFCLACLMMTGWTWMRYSYAWPATQDSIICERDVLWKKGIKQQGQNHYDACAFEVLTRQYLAVRGTVSAEYGPDGTSINGYFSPSEDRGFSYGLLTVTLAKDTPEDYFGVERTITGRLKCGYGARLVAGLMTPAKRNATCFDLTFDTTASRYHPASIAGLVVGAMGCLIFGLYLRRWLRERKAA